MVQKHGKTLVSSVLIQTENTTKMPLKTCDLKNEMPVVDCLKNCKYFRILFRIPIINLIVFREVMIVFL